MNKALFLPLALSLAFISPVLGQDNPDQAYFSPDQLDNLVAPVALYPDPLLAQVLLAATFPDQIDDASRFARANADPRYLDDQPWDVSVKAVAHYPTVLFNMAEKMDWTTALGQAYAAQSSDVMGAVQRLRVEARSAGNLRSSPQMEVREEGGYVEIWPANPQYIYVPVYDPALVYYRRPGFLMGITFGRGFFIGAWLNHDCDWRYHRVYYHGWDSGPGWMMRSRPYVHATNVYVNVNYRNVVINRTVVDRRVDYDRLNRYQGVHRDVHFDNIRAHDHGVVNRDFHDAHPDPHRDRPVQSWRDDHSEQRRHDVLPAERHDVRPPERHDDRPAPPAQAFQHEHHDATPVNRPAPELRPQHSAPQRESHDNHGSQNKDAHRDSRDKDHKDK